ncbi:MAG: addiction module protein [Sphingobium sp.]
MTTQIESLGLSHLNTQERLDLIDELWESVGEEITATPLCDEAVQEIQRRLAAHVADPSHAVPWEEVEAKALARLRK